MISKHVVSSTQTLELSRVFRIIDSKRDGTLDKEELLEAMQDYSATLKLTQEQVIDLFDKLDTKGSGSVEFSEFVT